MVALVAVAMLAACSREAPAPEPVRPVVLSRVAVGTTQALAVFAGEVKPRHEADLAFRIAGKLVERKVDVGAFVRRGQPLARLDPADVALQAQAQEAAVAAATTDATFARAEFERYENLHRQKFVSPSALDQKRNAMNAAVARLEQARATLAVTRNQAGYATLVASGEGMITAIHVEVGQVVGAGQVVMRLAETGEREVAIAVPEHRLDEVRQAKQLVVALWATPQKRYAARVREISPAVDPATRTYSVRIAVPGADAALGWGMTANVAVVGDGDPAAALVPLGAIYHRPDGQPAVWVFDQATGKVALRGIELGAFREDGAVVKKGLADGEWVVAAGANKLTEGQVVKPYEQPGVAGVAPPQKRAGSQLLAGGPVDLR
ncbi:MAG TPA: efflux RND transporter periplasmic adaptor subunit [Casimicrobiaceae bacterium]|nr:efflux RND transporter periplasmic adaptor subunit [Casimicrobiaceae bacterium]